jgi:uncharacterized protein (TIGR02453 family)
MLAWRELEDAMAAGKRFGGFPKETVRFFRLLEKNNSKAWFEAHRPYFERNVLEPSRAFVVAMGERLARLSPDVNADPRTDRSIFRLHRDVRFSKDKSPYKTNLGLYFWEGRGKRMECPGYYFHLEPPRLMLGAGMYVFPKPVLARYRKAVVDRRKGGALRRVVAGLEKKGYEVGGEHYKRVPRGFDPDHPGADLLRHNGLWASTEVRIPGELHGPGIVKWCFDRFRAMDPLQRWVVQHLT